MTHSEAWITRPSYPSAMDMVIQVSVTAAFVYVMKGLTRALPQILGFGRKRCLDQNTQFGRFYGVHKVDQWRTKLQVVEEPTLSKFRQPPNVFNVNNSSKLNIV